MSRERPLKALIVDPTLPASHAVLAEVALDAPRATARFALRPAAVGEDGRPLRHLDGVRVRTIGDALAYSVPGAARYLTAGRQVALAVECAESACDDVRCRDRRPGDPPELHPVHGWTRVGRPMGGRADGAPHGSAAPPDGRRVA